MENIRFINIGYGNLVAANRIITIYKGRKVEEFETSKIGIKDIMHSILGLSKN